MEYVILGQALITGSAAISAASLHTVNSIVERKVLKKGDEEIEVERKREREEELEIEAKRPLEVGVNHHKHHHPLNEVDHDQGSFVCGGCKRSGQEGRRYKCHVDGCEFELHKVCATFPVMLDGGRESFHPPQEEVAADPADEVGTVETFAHSQHGVKEVFKHAESYTCVHCNNNGKGARFRCDECQIDLHPICAKSPTRLRSFMHPEHELELITRPHFVDCSACGHGKKSNARVYACLECKFYLHPICSEWPQYLFHELHPIVHPLLFEIVSSKHRCSACKKKCKASVYHCEKCDESFHPDCLLRFTLTGSTDGKMDKFRKELLSHTAFHLGYVGLKSAAGLVFV